MAKVPLAGAFLFYRRLVWTVFLCADSTPQPETFS